MAIDLYYSPGDIQSVLLIAVVKHLNLKCSLNALAESTGSEERKGVDSEDKLPLANDDGFKISGAISIIRFASCC